MTRPARSVRRAIGWLRWIHLAPLLTVLTLTAWALASPIGSSPDDDYHLVSTWCSRGASDVCEPIADHNLRLVSTAFGSSTCYALVSERSAACQDSLGLALDGRALVTDRGNFHHKYPAVFYATMGLFAGDDLVQSALIMRVVNLFLFVGLATTLAALLPGPRSRTLLWGWLVSMVPLGMFLIPSNNPSGWAVTGVGTAFMALLGWFESRGKRRWALGALYVVGILMAAGARSDAALYAAGATAVAALLTWSRGRPWLLRSILPIAGLIVIAALFLSTEQADVGVNGIPGGDASSVPTSLGGFAALAVRNLVALPYLWTGVWGTWALGWFDTQLPAIVPWAAAAAFVTVAFAGLGLLNRRKAISIAGVIAMLVILPVYLLTAGGDVVGSQFQPRYLLPLIVLLSLILVVATPRSPGVRFSSVQTLTILAALALANAVALQVTIRRYVTGADQQGFNLDAGAEWWWHGAPVGPMAVWFVGSAAFAALLAVLWPVLRRQATAAAQVAAAEPQELGATALPMAR